MIIGDTSAAGKVGNLRVGFSLRFLPCTGYVIHEAIRDALSGAVRQSLQYSARCQVRNAADTAWLDVGDASYFQVTRKNSGTDTADVTVQRPEVWSPFIAGGTYEDVLRPSGRAFRIFAGLTIAGTHYETQVFIGRIETYSEPQGPEGGAINLRLLDMRSQMKKVDAAVGTDSETVYRQVQRQIKTAEENGIMTAGILSKGTLTAPDAILAQSAVLGATGTTYDAIKNALPGVPAIKVTPQGALSTGVLEVDQTEESEYAFEFTDDSIYLATRYQSDTSSFNTCKCWGWVAGGAYETSEVSDASDVDERGRILYAAGLIGKPGVSLAEAEELARQGIANVLRGQISFEFVYNPFLDVGMRVKVTSDRFDLAPSYVWINSVRHQYQVGECRTYLDKASVVTI